MKILATVGTSKFQFKRLFEYTVMATQDCGITISEMYWQTGFTDVSQVPCQNFKLNSFSFCERDRFSNLIEYCDIVITHGAAGTILQCNRLGKKPLILAREHDRNEHSDDHQVHSAERFSQLGLCDKFECAHSLTNLLDLGASPCTRVKLNASAINDFFKNNN